MTDVADLLMPKLGLTMTEGTVSRWLAAPGTRFAAGDVIVIVETDKIANEVEAPAAGELVALLSGEGEVVPVGAAIAQWRLDGGAPAARGAHEPSTRPAARESAQLPAVHDDAPASPPPGSGDRIIATPYARRLAGQIGLGLERIVGSGPRGRIKAADVLLARDKKAAEQQIVPAAAAAMRHNEPGSARAVALSFATADVDVSALRAVDARLAGAYDRPFERRAYIALACVKVLDDESSTTVRVGVPFKGGIATMEGAARDTLSVVAARLGQLEARSGGGDVAMFIVEDRTRLLVPAVPEGWRMALGVGGVRTARGGETRHEMTLTLVYDAGEIDHVSANEMLGRITALLEEPLHLLAA